MKFNKTMAVVGLVMVLTLVQAVLYHTSSVSNQ